MKSPQLEPKTATYNPRGTLFWVKLGVYGIHHRVVDDREHNPDEISGGTKGEVLGGPVRLEGGGG